MPQEINRKNPSAANLLSAALDIKTIRPHVHQHPTSNLTYNVVGLQCRIY